MSNSRNLADLLDANGDVKATSLDNTSLGGLTDANTTATSNLGLGTGAVDSITTGDYNVGVGDGAGTAITTGSWNTAVGANALNSNTTGFSNTAVGYYALYLNTTGASNTAVGRQALRYNTTGINNVASGSQALYNNTTASNNTANGHLALRYNTTGANNTAVGYSALAANTTGANNTANGYQSLYSNTTGANNTANGYNALVLNTTGAHNTASGYNALYSNTTGIYNTAIGSNTLVSNTTGNVNVATGYQALYNNTTGASNTATGTYTLLFNTVGSFNVAAGQQALYYNTTGNNNIASGYLSLNTNTTGDNNTSIGTYALQLNNTGIGNTATGYYSLRNNLGNYNTALGYTAGDNITTGSSNIMIGAGVDAPSATASNQLNIGNTIYGDMSTGNVGIGTSSPGAALDVEGTISLGASKAGVIFNSTVTPANNNVGSIGLVSGTINGPASANAYSKISGLRVAPTTSGSFNGAAEIAGLKVETFNGQSATMATGLSVDAPTGGDVNYAAILNGGNVGIGTSAPSAELDVVGEIKHTQLTSNNHTLIEANDYLVSHIGTTKRFELNSSTIGSLTDGNELAVTFNLNSFDKEWLFSIKLIGTQGTSVNCRHVVEKQWAFFGEVALLSNLNSVTKHIQNLTDAEVYMEATGTNYQARLIVAHSAQALTRSVTWGLSIEVMTDGLLYANPVEITSAVIQAV